MTVIGWGQIALTLSLVFLAAVPLGGYVGAVMQGARSALSPVLGPVERGLYALCGVDPARGMSWRGYAAALLVPNALHFLLLYAILRLQFYLPFNPQGFSGMSPRLAFNTGISFVTNINWQAYAGETTLSHGAQMLGLTVHNLLSAATGIAAACAVSRAFAAGGLRTLGNFWADLTPATLYTLLPLSLVVAALLLAMGVPQTLAGSLDATTLEGAKQTIALGPVAFQEAIKLLGTNGGGFFNATSAHPFENPTALSNLLENWSFLLLPFSMAVAFGHIVGDRRQDFVLMWATGALLATFAGLAYAAEAAGNPLLHALGVDALAGNMEGKEVRFGVAASALFAAGTTATSTGAVIAMRDSFTPLGGFVLLLLMQLGEVVPGSVGSGLYGILVFALLAVFVAGLNAVSLDLGHGQQRQRVRRHLRRHEPVGLRAGISHAAGAVRFPGAGAGHRGQPGGKPKLPPSAGTFPTHGPLFVGLLMGVILILGGLQFLPTLSLGPLAEHFAMLAGKTFQETLGMAQTADTIALFDGAIIARAARDAFQAQSSPADPQPRHLRDRSGGSAGDGAGGSQWRDRAALDVRRLHRRLAVADGAVRHVCRGRGGGSGPGARRQPAPRPQRRHGQAAGQRRRPQPQHAPPASALRVGNLVLVEAGDLTPSDGEIIEGVASVNESAVTGESAPVIREAGGDRSAVTGSTQVISDWLVVRITANPGSTFLDRMIGLVEGASRRKAPNEIALDILLAGGPGARGPWTRC